MPNQKISELTTATNPSVSDVLPIVNGGSTKKITAASLLTNTLSATMLSVSAIRINDNVFLRSGNAVSLALGNCFTGEALLKANTDLSVGYRNMFIGEYAGRGCNKGVYGGQAVNNIAIGSSAGRNLGGDDDPSCSGRTLGNTHNLLIGSCVGKYLCSGDGYTSSKNVAIGNLNSISGRNRFNNNVSIGYGAAKYLQCSQNNVIIGYNAGSPSSGGGLPLNNVAIGAHAGHGSFKLNSNGNVVIGYRSNVGYNSCITSSVAIGSFSQASKSAATVLGAGARAYEVGDVVIGAGSRSRFLASHQIVIGRNNSFTPQAIGSPLSGAIVLGSCNSNISTSFVLGSPVFPLSARPDTTLAGQVSSLFVTINGENRRLAIFS